MISYHPRFGPRFINDQLKGNIGLQPMLKNKNDMNKNHTSKIIVNSMLIAMVVMIMQCTTAPEWHTKNEELIRQHNLTKRELPGLPENSLQSNLDHTKVTSLESIATTELYPGVKANIFWGTGVMVARLQVEPHAKVSEEELAADKFVFVLEGSVNQLVNGSMISMSGSKREEPDGIHSATPRTDFVYLPKGAKSAIETGASGAVLLEVHSPIRLDYLQKAGIKDLPSEIADISTSQTPNINANKVYDLYDIQLVNLAPGAIQDWCQVGICS